MITNGLLAAPPAVTIALVEQRARDEAKLKKEIAELEAEFRALAEMIRKEEPWPYSRFSDAVKEGQKCMPQGDTLEAMRQVARQKVELAKDILAKLNDFPEKDICIAWQKIWLPNTWRSEHEFGPSYRYEHSEDRHREERFGRPEIDDFFPFQDSTNSSYVSMCVKWKTVGQNYSAADLKTAAKMFCKMP